MSGRRPERAFIAAGSNIDPENNLLSALRRLCQFVKIEAVSTFYRTQPVGPHAESSPEFLNGVFRIRTPLPPERLKNDVLRRIEAELGRVRTADKFAPRPIDLDLILYGSHVISEPHLFLPDPEIASRNFIAVPLLELAPALVLPDSGVRLGDLPSARNVGTMAADGDITHKMRAEAKKCRKLGKITY